MITLSELSDYLKKSIIYLDRLNDEHTEVSRGCLLNPSKEAYRKAILLYEEYMKASKKILNDLREFISNYSDEEFFGILEELVNEACMSITKLENAVSVKHTSFVEGMKLIQGAVLDATDDPTSLNKFEGFLTYDL